jgi:glucoamylase
MMPEQVWDYEDYPQEDLYKGQSAGSAQPLVWAHAEYIKLLRSTVDGQVFDCIPLVRDRYCVEPGKRAFKSSVEIFQATRPIRRIAAGMTLRFVNPERFQVIYTTDDWATNARLESHPVGQAIFFADIATAAGQTGKIIFTAYWPAEDRWVGRNFEVEIV